ncbi:MAG: bile acid:sodium symporter [Pirellulaceae bacterium]
MIRQGATRSSMTSFLKKQWFLVGLATVLLIGFIGWKPLSPLAEVAWLRSCVVAGVLFLMALPLETKSIWQTLSRPGAALLASTINMGLVPLLGWVAAQFATNGLAEGIIVACVAPCTMASAAVWVRRAGGNDSVAIMVTILTNLTCFVLTPLWLASLLGQSVDMELWPMIRKLGLLVVLPMVLGQLFRSAAVVREIATVRKKHLSTTCQVGILYMVLVGAIECGRTLGNANSAVQVSTFDFAGMTLLVTLVHVIALALGIVLAKSFRMKPENQIAVGVAGSQKTLMIGLHIALNYFGGLAILPMVTYHVSQLLLDTFIVDAWRKRHSP